MTNEEIIAAGQQIYDETEVAANTSERVGGVIKGIGQNLADKDTAIEAQAARNGYYQCTVNSNQLAVTAPGFTLPAHGGNIRIKMSAPATGASTLNINGTGAKQLLYNGAALSSANTWEKDEIISVFYDPSGSGQYLASNSQGGGGKAEKIKYDNSQSGLSAENVQGAIDELAEKTDVSVSGVSSFEQGQIDDSGKDSTASASYYIRTPASSPIPIINGQTMNLTFTYKNSSGTVLTGTTRVYRYLNGTFVSYSQTTETSYSVVCDGTFNQLRVRFYRNNVGSSYPYCNVKHIVEKTLKEVAEQVDTNTADIALIAADLQDTSLSVEGMEAQTTNKRTFVASDAESGYFNTGEMFYVPKTYEKSVRLKIEVHPGDHAIIYGKGGGNGAASVYALVDKYRRVLSKAGSGSSLSTPLEVDITEDCYLLAGVYTNLAKDASQFKVVITSNIKARVDALMNKSNRVVAPKFWNLPFPKTKDTIKVLSLGNSFAQDGSQYLDRLMTAAGVDASKYCYYFTFESGATLAGYVSWYKNGRTINCIDKNNSYTSTPRAGNIIMTSSGSLKTIISQDWDVIVLQQASTDAWNWDTYQPYLTELIGLIKRDCPNATIAWYHTWRTHSGDETISVMPAQKAPRYEYRFDMLIDNVKKVRNEIGIDIIIPVGTAIENIRSTSFNDSKDMMRDDKHLEYGVPMYVAGCTWMDTIFAPILGKSCLGNTLTIGEGTDTIPVTDDNKLLCQQCAHAAVMNMFEVTTGLETAG